MARVMLPLASTDPLALTLTVTVSVVAFVFVPELSLVVPEVLVDEELALLDPVGVVVGTLGVVVVVDDELDVEVVGDGAVATGVPAASVFWPLVLAILVARTNRLLADTYRPLVSCNRDVCP